MSSEEEKFGGKKASDGRRSRIPWENGSNSRSQEEQHIDKLRRRYTNGRRVLRHTGMAETLKIEVMVNIGEKSLVENDRHFLLMKKISF